MYMHSPLILAKHKRDYVLQPLCQHLGFEPEVQGACCAARSHTRLGRALYVARH